MTVRVKTLLTLSLTLLALVLVLYLVLERVLDVRFAAVERSDAERNVERLRQAFYNDVAGICQKTSDWASWDDAYRFALDRNHAFVEANLAPSTFEGMGLDAILIFDGRGELISGTAFDGGAGALTAPPHALMTRHFGPASGLIAHPGEKSVKAGLLLTAGLPPALFCSMPILTTDGVGPVRGSIVFLRSFAERQKEALARMTRLDLAFAAEGEPGFTPELADALKALPAAETIRIDVPNESNLVGFTRFVDFYERQSLVARVSMPREIHRQEQLALRYVLAALVGVGLVCVLVIALLMERLVLGKVATLSHQVIGITETFDFSARVAGGVRGDELSRLGGAINRLLTAVEQVTFSSNESDAKYAAIESQLPVALACQDVVLGEDDRAADLLFREITDAFAAVMGVRKDALGRPLSDALDLPPAALAAWLAAVDRARSVPGPQSFELHVRTGARVRVTVVHFGQRRVLAHLTVLGQSDRHAPAGGRGEG